MALPPKLETFDIRASLRLTFDEVCVSFDLEGFKARKSVRLTNRQRTRDTPLLPNGLEAIRLSSSLNRSVENVWPPVGLKRLFIEKEWLMFNQGPAGVM